MRALLALTVAFALCACSQEYLDRKNAERDTAYCQSIGIGPSDSRFPDCRITAAQLRLQQEQRDAAVGLGMLSVGSGVYQTSQPTYGNRMTCVQTGTVTSCQ